MFLEIVSTKGFRVCLLKGPIQLQAKSNPIEIAGVATPGHFLLGINTRRSTLCMTASSLSPDCQIWSPCSSVPSTSDNDSNLARRIWLTSHDHHPGHIATITIFQSHTHSCKMSSGPVRNRRRRAQTPFYHLAAARQGPTTSQLRVEPAPLRDVIEITTDEEISSQVSVIEIMTTDDEDASQTPVHTHHEPAVS
jgi:hypothetical protein